MTSTLLKRHLKAAADLVAIRPDRPNSWQYDWWVEKARAYVRDQDMTPKQAQGFYIRIGVK